MMGVLIEDSPVNVSSEDDDDDDDDDEVAIVKAVPALPRCLFQDKWTRRAERYGLDAYTFQNMVLCKMPPIFFNTLFFLNGHPACSNTQDLDIIDMFAGLGYFYKFAVLRGHSAARYDKRLQEQYHDINGKFLGWLSAVQLCRRLRAGGLAPWAPVCSSWIWMVRCVTLRSRLQPLGPEPAERRHAIVKAGNLMVSRVSACQLYLTCRGRVCWHNEQPTSSLMPDHPRQLEIKHVLQQHPQGMLMPMGAYHSIHTWLGAFGGRTPKSTRLISNCGYVLCLRRAMRREDISSLANSTPTYVKNSFRAMCGLSAITGKPSELSRSQEYPPLFAEQTIVAWEAVSRQWAGRIVRFNSDLDMPADEAIWFSDLWEDLELRECASIMRVPFDRLIV